MCSLAIECVLLRENVQLLLECGAEFWSSNEKEEEKGSEKKGEDKGPVLLECRVGSEFRV